ncbi:sulfotransferase domain-containing protein [Calditrichota bacterium]
MNKLNNSIIVVSGLPRSGTSMMMQVLNAMEIPVYTDNKRVPDQNNPRGYFEHKIVKNLKEDSSWLKLVKGKAVKIISHLLVYLPKNFHYKILFLQRDMNEIIHSQNKMLMKNKMNIDSANPELLKKIFQKNLIQIKNWEKDNPNAKILYLNYTDLLHTPDNELKKIQQFLDLEVAPLDLSHIISQDLYHSRNTQL